ncbi:MAG: NYN domain-containing protein [Brevundimonas sp.]|uniref:NYN domain-containing protein n=1 Tax=Brevundimonas sp. TaxID=1871086 RepID=UPI002AB9C46D|nr:NYN domain-containing protein [Brevundimonas sp.]MDZ4113420.1 NYN domain-containing protein [Brevundimonas sp.]
MATLLLVDGENFKAKIKTAFRLAGVDRPAWHEYDFAGLFAHVLKGTVITQTRFYFGKLRFDPDSAQKSNQLIQEQRLLKTHLEASGFEVVLAGQVRGQGEGRHKVFKEKGVDVRIAVDMIASACDGRASELTVASSDSDLQPAIHEVTKRGVRCVYLGFELNPNKGLTYTTGRAVLIRNAEVLQFGNTASDRRAA